MVYACFYSQFVSLQAVEAVKAAPENWPSCFFHFHFHFIHQAHQWYELKIMFMRTARIAWNI